VLLAYARFGIDIKAIFMVVVDVRFDCFKRIAQLLVKGIEKSSTKSKAKEIKVKMRDFAPGDMFAGTTFGNQAVDMGIPFKIPAKGMKDTNKARCEGFGFVYLMEQAQDDTANRGKQAVEQRPVFQKKGA